MPRYLNDLDVFYDPSQAHAFSPAFDEGPSPPIPPNLLTLIVSSSIVNGNVVPTYGKITGSQYTVAIDPYTQGVELTQLKRHDAGFVKIWSGEPGHQMFVGWVGEQQPRITGPFVDDEAAYLLDPAAIIRNNPAFPVLMFPLQVSSGSGGAIRYKTTDVVNSQQQVVRYRTEQDLAATTMNGVIEPLAIRLQPSFFSSDVPVNPHQPLGFVGQGNPDFFNATDQVVTVYYYDTSQHNVPFVDTDLGQSVNTYDYVVVNGVTVTASLSSIHAPVTGAMVPSQQSLEPFTDLRYVRNVPPTVYENTALLSALSPMTGSTDNYVAYNQRSATCGWSYDGDTAIGTDSLAFGGMTY